MSFHRQAEFATALRTPSLKPPYAPGRFAVYRSNRYAALTDSLAATYRATERIVGARFFAEMALAFIDMHPPCSPVLHKFGMELPEFIERALSAEELPYLADVARIERAWMEAYHAADQAPLAAIMLHGQSDDAVLAARFALHPTMDLIRSLYPAGSIWQMNAEHGAAHEIEEWRAENVLVWRPELDVHVRIIPGDTAAFLTALRMDKSLGDAAEAGLGANPTFDLPSQLAGAFDLGLIARASLFEAAES
jgi:hypothetical protein